MRTQQIEFWSGDFGRDYTDRNTTDHKAWNRQYIEKYGVSRLNMNDEFLKDLPKNLRVLEVGCNTGQQLEALRQQGFGNVNGIELQFYAIKNARNRVHGIPVLQGSGFEIPFKTGSFDLVFTSGVLIHIAPDDLSTIMGEIYRCTSRFIWGFEYYSDSMTEINYRGNTSVLWKADHASIFMRSFPDLTLIKKKFYQYIDGNEHGNVDCMYLLEKQT
jgi:pseudaminic acid biosynthesis-associated methylase